MNDIRVRFAPSPTGYLHIGGLRTAFFNWLFARHNNGKFLLRIEDTDTVRSKPEFTDAIIQSLEWASIASDEPLIIQSQRIDFYKEKIHYLLDTGKAYRCYCPTNAAESMEDYFKYDGKCRANLGKPVDGERAFVIRIALPLEQKTIEFDDTIRGRVSFDSNQFDDFIIARTDGTPIYNFVVVVDDAAMRISHIIRGEDHISNTPKQIVLYKAFGYEIPQFAHLPLILNAAGGRLSKRDAATAVTDYMKQGYLADALCNYLVRLGWAHGDQEIFTREELVNLFSLEEINKKGAIFDQQKLDWMNGMFIRQATVEHLLTLIIRDVEPQFLSNVSSWNKERIYAALSLYKERVKTLRDFINELQILHDGPSAINAEDRQWINEKTGILTTTFLEALESVSMFNHEKLSGIAKEIAKNYGIKLVALAQPLRLALIGKTNGPGVFELMEFLGQAETMRRLKIFLGLLES